MGRALSHSLNVEQAAREICESARELFDARAAMLARLLPGEQRLEVVATAGDPGPALRAGVSIAPEMGIPWVAAREKRSVFTPDVLRDPRVTLTPELGACIGESEDRAMVCVPLHAQGSGGAGGRRPSPGRWTSRPGAGASCAPCSGSGAVGSRHSGSWSRGGLSGP